MLRVSIRFPASLAARKTCFLPHPSDVTMQDLNSEVNYVGAPVLLVLARPMHPGSGEDGGWGCRAHPEPPGPVPRAEVAAGGSQDGSGAELLTSGVSRDFGCRCWKASLALFGPPSRGFYGPANN